MATISHHTISLDGYIAGPGDSVEWSFEYGEPTSLAQETMERVGAIVAGRRWHDLARERWSGVDGIYGGKFTGIVSVLTHDPPERSEDERIRFVTGSIEDAVATAQADAGERDVGIFGGSLTRQCLDAGLLDEIVLHVVPVLLGGGVPLLGEGYERIELERLYLGEAERLTDLRLRVVRA
jgi:dihydrofolate reductase